MQMTKEIKTEVNEMYSSILKYMERKRPGARHWSKKDLERILWAHRNEGDYTEVKQSKLYNKYSGEYCQLLCGINLWIEGELKN